MERFTKTELENFESWRGLLALIVVFAHSYQIFLFPFYNNEFYFSIVCLAANFAVVMFFVLSGLLISLSILNLTKEKDFNWVQYLSNRFFRIYPGLIIVLLISILLFFLLPLFNGGTEIFHTPGENNLPRINYSITVRDIVKTLFLLQPGVVNVNGPLWTLFIEWWLYISAMCLISLYFANKVINRFLLIILSFLAFGLCYYGYGVVSIYFIIIWYSAFFYTRSENRAILLKIYFLLAFILICIAFIIGGMEIWDINKANKIIFGLIQLSIGLLSIPLLSKFQVGDYFKRMAKYSYTLYIFHFPVLLFIFFVTRKYIYDNEYMVLVTSSITFVGVIILSKYLAKVAEFRYRFQSRR